MGQVWEESDWDRPGYVNGKRDHLFVKRPPNGEKGNCGPYKFTLMNFKRPHGRAFHVAWFAFFACFIMWFAIPPLMVTFKKPPCQSPDSETCVACVALFPDVGLMAADKACKVCAPNANGKGKGCGGLGLTKHQTLVSNVVSVSGTIIVRVLIGPLADWLGVRTTYSAVLILCSIPGFCVCWVNSYEGFVVVRFFISLVGGSFVVTQLWTTIMFHSNVVGLANATSAGWGNLGGGAALAIMGAVFDAMKKDGMSNDSAWRRTLAWPPAVLFLTGVFAYFFTDDCPYGNYSEMKKRKALEPEKVDDGSDLAGGAEPVSIAGRSLAMAFYNWRTWVLFLVYAFSFGVELVVNGNISLYFSDCFALKQADGGLAGSLFGLFNIFARSLGGYVSDKMNDRWGVRGRLWALFLCTLGMGILLLVFSTITKDDGGFGGALACLAAWALFLAMTEGAVFAVVPYIEPTAVGGVAGIVGAGGNCGALGGNFILRLGVRPGWMVLGWLSTISAFLVPLLWCPGVGSMFRAQTDNLPELTLPAAPTKKMADDADMAPPAARNVQLTPMAPPPQQQPQQVGVGMPGSTFGSPGGHQPMIQMQQPGMQQFEMQQQPGMHYPGMQQLGMQYPGMQQPGMQYPGMQFPGMQYPMQTGMYNGIA